MSGVPQLDARYSAHAMVRSLSLQPPGRHISIHVTTEVQPCAHRSLDSIDSTQTPAAPVSLTSQTALNIVGGPSCEEFEFNLSPPSDVIDQQDDLFAPLFPLGENTVFIDMDESSVIEDFGAY